MFLGLAFLFQSCSLGEGCEKGEGERVIRDLDLSPIQTITFGIAGNLVIKNGAEQKVTVEGQANMQDIMRTKVDNGNWNIMFDKCTNLHEAFDIVVTLPTLQAVVLSGAGSIVLEDTVESKNFQSIITGSGTIITKVIAEQVATEILGSGTIEAEGSTEQLKVTLSGSGTIDNFDMTAKIANIIVSGSGEIFVKVTDELNVIIEGSGNVTYRGNPTVNPTILGSGQIFDGN